MSVNLGVIGTNVTVRALDINTTTNAIYRHNFPGADLQQCNIQV